MTWATDHVFVAGGDFVSTHWPDFQAQSGISAVVVISAEAPPAYVDPPPWAVLWLPVGDEAAYGLDHLQLGTQFIDTALQAGRCVLLHGPKGVHRTRPLLAAHLVAGGKSLARTLHELEEKPWLPPYRGNRELLEVFIQRRAPG
jgi:hypothetical protein